jgi:uncharacterized protein
VRRSAIVLATAVVLFVVTALPAAAHVSVGPSEATKGGFATLTFQVPNEEEFASTTGVQVNFPDDPQAAIADASVQPVEGFTVNVQKATLTTPVTTDEGDELDERVRSVTWTATGDGIRPGEFQQFRISVGLPDGVDELVFPTIQTYSEGEPVQWVEATPPGGPEPEHPAPFVTLVEGSGDGGEAAGTTPTTAASANGSASAVATADLATKDDVDSAKRISIVALIVGLLGVIIAIVAVVLSRRRTA